jgi:hypothetical protein
MGGAALLLPASPENTPTPAPLAPVPDPDPLEDGAVIKGLVKIKGEIPKRAKITTTADPKCAALHKDPLLTDDVIAGPAGHLQWAFVYVKEGLGDQKFTAPKTPVILEQKGCRFEPHVFGLMVGQDLKIKNGDDLMHIIHVVPKANREWGFSQAKVGEERIKVFDNKELMIRVFCDVHQWMQAWMGVLEHPFHGVTGPDGKFTIKGLPAGRYTLEVWHEKYAPVTQEIELKAKESKTANFELTELRK